MFKKIHFAVPSLMVAFLLLAPFGGVIATADENQAASGQAIKSSPDIDLSRPEMGLEDMEAYLKGLETSVAAKKTMSTRESPGVVTVITSTDIKNSGARDLFDILSLLAPGFTFGNDIESATGIGFRGLFALEGKILLLIDGIEANDEVFSNTLFQNHYPASIIDRVEIIRGPGSAIYGGYASLGVISVITKGSSTNGVYASVLNSQMGGGPSHRNLTAGFGKQVNPDLSFSLFAVKGIGNRSDRDYVDLAGSHTPMIGNFRNDPQFVNANIKWVGADFRAIVDNYNTKHNNFTDVLGPRSYEETFSSYIVDFKYTFQPTPNLKIIPRLNYKVDHPYTEGAYDYVTAGQPTPFALHIFSRKFLESVTAIWDVAPNLNLVAGLENTHVKLAFPTESLNNSIYPEHFRIFSNEGFWNRDTAIFAQALLMTDIANITLGGRYENSLRFGSAFVPRLGLTKVIEPFHGKIIIGKSFRTPSGVQADRVPSAGYQLHPESAMNYEAEIGYRISTEMFLQANVFDIRVNDVLSYQAPADPTLPGTYQNGGTIGTRGFEMEYRYQLPATIVAANYAYYTATANTVSAFAVPGRSNVYQGMPQHRLNLYGGYSFNERFSIHPSLSFYGVKYAYNSYDGAGNLRLQTFNPTWIANLNFRIRNILVSGLEVDLGSHNLFNADTILANPNSDKVAGLPIASRTYDIAVSYTREL